MIDRNDLEGNVEAETEGGTWGRLVGRSYPLCYQEGKQCQEDCGNFSWNERSGEPPICKRNRKNVLYGDDCLYEDE